MVETNLATCAFLSYSQIPWNDKGVQNETYLFYLKKMRYLKLLTTVVIDMILGWIRVCVDTP